MTEADALAALSSISSETRLRILKTLVAAGPDGLTAGEIAVLVGATPSRASFHLANMAEAGLLTSSRQSRQISYRVDFSAMGALIRYLLEDCCNNNDTVRACCQPAGKC
ncbi:ArsR/SmtB family transcription factor [Roseibium sediminicola]|uniref:Helix-turn-helix domain-containing protein n=1 Tax=Roseibium sediminicola TaxID=2933272 RepID=A0ABT0GTB4_9HYPH|nr:metalloregulator ArsR/SmtB family transcription factor [Roseibium sp. CAU 1639]MCK7612677.1 helix-turn-helix domain-containing protein [Roseibium sp. CAU 1639]